MSKRIRTAEESARRESEISKLAVFTQLADSTAPRDPRMRGDHYRRHFIDAHRTIEILQLRIKELERERDAAKADRDHIMSRSVTRTVAEEERVSAFKLAREKAALLFEGPDGEPTASSEAIRAISDPKTKWE